MFKGHKIVCISYGDTDAFLSAAKLNIKTALIKGKADEGFVYCRSDIDEEFFKRNQSIFNEKRGGGLLALETIHYYGDPKKS